jgi:peroxiredoxin
MVQRQRHRSSAAITGALQLVSRRGLWCGTAAFTAAAALACAAPAASPPADSTTMPATGTRAPDFELDRLDGGTLRLSDHLGKKVVLLDFWATWCTPCRAAMPQLEQLYQRHQADGLLVLGISIDGPESVAQVRAEVAKTGVSFPILLDRDTRVASLYSPRATAPYGVLIGRGGTVVSRREGYSHGGHEALAEEVRSALAEPAPR